jgi:hypothetical protein
VRHLIATTLAAAAIACSSPAAEQTSPKAAGQASPKQEAAKLEANLPEGWKARLDDPAAKTDAVRVTTERDSLTFTSGPAGIYYKPDMKAEKDYTVSATFSQLKPTPQPQPYGLFIAGADLDKDTARYTTLTVRGDGKYQIAAWSGGKPSILVDWTAASPMADPKGVKTSNTLTIRAMQDAVHFLIGEKELHQMPRARAGGDGIAGVRVGPGLSVQVDKLSVKKFP